MSEDSKMNKILSAGTKVEISTEATDTLDADLTYTEIQCALTGLSTEASENEQVETTSLCETYAKTYMSGLKDADTASSDAFFVPSSDEGKAMQAAANSKALYALKVTFNDDSTWESLGTVQPFGFVVSVGDVVKTTFNFKLSGEPKLTVV